MKVKFRFGLDEEVVTPFGKRGYVEMLGYDDGGRKYYVRYKGGAAWYPERMLHQNFGE